MLLSHTRLVTATIAATSAVALGTVAAPALTVRATPKKITPAGAGAVKLGKTHGQLAAARLVGRIGPGCELGGPNTRSARLRAPLKGSVDYTQSSPRKVTVVTVRGGATARGVGIGATRAAVRQAYPKVVFDHATDETFAITLAKVPRSGGGRLQFAIDTTTKKVTLIGIPQISFCE
jgi:hypothetical protein